MIVVHITVNTLHRGDNKVSITKTVYEQIKLSIGSLPPERGGILGGNQQRIDKFYFDEKARQEGRRYTPNLEIINQVILPRWEQSKTILKGWVHSHPSGCNLLSASDQIYLKNIVNYLHKFDKNYQEMIGFIVQSTVDHGEFELYAYRINIWEEQSQRLAIKIIANNLDS